MAVHVVDDSMNDLLKPALRSCAILCPFCKKSVAFTPWLSNVAVRHEGDVNESLHFEIELTAVTRHTCQEVSDADPGEGAAK